MRVWTVSEVKAGTLTQCLGVGRYFDADPHSVVVKKKLRDWQRGPFSPYRGLHQPEPDIIISCGSMAPPHVFAIARACHRKPFTVYLQTPWPDFADRFDLAFISRHDWNDEKAAKSNFRQMLGVPHQITREKLDRLRPEARQKWLKGDVRAITVLIGGSNGAYVFDEPTIEGLLAAIQHLAAQGWTALVSTSRRSEPVLLQRLLALNNERIVVWNRTGDNPYQEFLAAADAFLITKDTITMNCEAVTTGRPVYSFDLAKTPCDKLDKFEWFHADMSQTLGLTRPFLGEILPYEYSPPDEARRIANVISDALPQL